MKWPRPRFGPAIFLTFFALILLTGSRERPWGDANPVWEVADNLVTRGSIAVDVRWPVDQPKSSDGNYYALNPLLNSLVHVPAAAVRQLVLLKWRKVSAVSLPLASHIAPAVLGALTLVFFFALARRFASAGSATLATLFVGLGTGLWVYARYPYTEIVQTACFTGFVLAMARAFDPKLRNPRTFFYVGLSAGLLVASKLVYVVCLPGAGLVLLYTLRANRRHLVHAVKWGALGLLPGTLLVVGYNWARFGGPFSSGYDFEFSGRLWVGFAGLFFSPGKSVFLYNPPLLLALFGIPMLVRRHRVFALTLALVLAPVLYTYARFLFWHGDYAWGPRYLVFAVPVLCLPLALLFDAVARSPRRRLLAVPLAAVLLAGMAVQTLGNAFYWDHWIRISKDASASWLGKPNRSGSIPKDRGNICDACFEDLHAQQWLPPFQPIVGHYWLLRHVPWGDSFRDAEKDAPWHMYTRMKVTIDEQWYNRARIDWWPIDWKNRAVAVVVACAYLGLLVFGAARWRAAMRHSRLQPP